MKIKVIQRTQIEREIIPFDGYTCEKVYKLLENYKAQILIDPDMMKSYVCMVDTLERIASANPLSKNDGFNLAYRIKPVYEIINNE